MDYVNAARKMTTASQTTVGNRVARLLKSVPMGHNQYSRHMFGQFRNFGLPLLSSIHFLTNELGTYLTIFQSKFKTSNGK